MPKSFSKLPFKEFSLSTDINWDYLISSAKSDTNPDTNILLIHDKLFYNDRLKFIIYTVYGNR